MQKPDNSILTRPIPKKFYKIVGVFIIFLILLCLVLLELVRVSDTITEQQVQQMLDKHCGQGKISAKEGYYSYEPQFRWDSASASCYTDIISGEFTCNCPHKP